MKQKRHSTVWLHRYLALLVVFLGMVAGATPENMENEPLIIEEQGSFLFGGTVITGEDGDTFHGDHGYAQYQIPILAKDLPLVMWHGGGQFSKTWESTPDGREGFQTIFVRRGFPVYIIDQPKRGRAGRTTVGTTIPDAKPDEARLFNIFRLGTWNPPEPPTYFPDVQSPQDEESLDQYFRQITPNIGPEELDAETREFQSDAASALFDRIGPGILLTHSSSGQYGWRTAMKNGKVKAIVSYEPATFAYPQRDPPAPVAEVEGYESLLEPDLVSEEQFQPLTTIPIHIVFGDYLEETELWPAIAERAEQFAEAVNSRGGDAEILHLPDAGLEGNTHFPFSDLNNLEVADLLSEYLTEKGLDE